MKCLGHHMKHLCEDTDNIIWLFSFEDSLGYSDLIRCEEDPSRVGVLTEKQLCRVTVGQKSLLFHAKQARRAFL